MVYNICGIFKTENFYINFYKMPAAFKVSFVLSLINMSQYTKSCIFFTSTSILKLSNMPV